jgi:hypothetical protein
VALGHAAAALLISSWKRTASVTMAVVSAGSVASVVRSRAAWPQSSIDAGVLGQELVQGGEAAGQAGEVDRQRAESGVDAVNELVGARLATTGCATRWRRR